MKLQLTIIALLLSLTATAQNIVLTSDSQEDKSVIIRVDKQGYGRYTLAIKFKDLDNCDFVDDKVYFSEKLKELYFDGTFPETLSTLKKCKNLRLVSVLESKMKDLKAQRFIPIQR